MKKVLFFFFALVTSIGTFAQGRCDFSTFNDGKVNNNYIESSNAEGWQATNCMVAAGWDESYAKEPDYTHSNLYGDNCNTIAALVLTGKLNYEGQLTSPTLTGGCGKLTVNYGLGVMSPDKCSIHVTVKQNGEAVQEFDIEETSFQNNTAYSLEKDINVAGDFTLEFVNNAPGLNSKQRDRVAIWNIEWTGYGAATKTVGSLAELDNNKTYAIHNANGGGSLIYNPELSDKFICLADAETWLGNQNGGLNANWTVPFDGNNPNHLWQIAKDNDKYYLYNVGAKAYAYLASVNGARIYSLTAEPTPINVTDNGNGTFGFNTSGNAYEYLCITNGFAEGPCRWWTYDDNGSVMLIEEAEYPADDIFGGMQVIEDFKNALAEAKAQYNAGSVYVKSDNLFTDPSQFESQWTDPEEGSVAASCDGDPETFWHSSWHGGSVTPGTHDFFITLNEPVGGEMELAMTRRKQALNDHILAFDVYASTDKESFVGTVNTPFTSNTETVTGTFEVPEGTQKLRFVIAKTDLQRGYGHFAEFKLFAQQLDPECFNAQNPEAAKALAEAIAAAEEVTAPTQEDIEALQTAVATYLEGDAKAFIASIRYKDTNLYFSTTEVPDNDITTYSLAAEPEYFIFTEGENGGYILQSESTGKYVGHSVANSWDFTNDASVWYIDNLEGELTTIRKDYGVGFGTDYAYAGAGVYTDKTISKGTIGYWYIEQKKGEPEPKPEPNTFMYVTADPANNAKVTELNTIKLTFDDDVFIMPAAQTFFGVNVVNSATGEEVAITALDYDAEAGNVVNILLSEPVTELGTYTITIPEMYIWNSKFDFADDNFGIGNGALYNPEFTLTYTVALDPRPQAGKVYTIRTENFGINSGTYYVGTSETPSLTPVEWICSVDDNGMYSFTTENGDELRFRGWAAGGTQWEITPMTDLTDNDMNAGKLPEEYIMPEAVVMRGYHSDGRFIYLNVNLNTGKYDHGANLYAPWNSSYTAFFVFEEVPEPTEWTGNINVPTSAATVDELLNYNVEFEGASNLDVSDYGLLAAVFDNSGDVYAVAFVGKDYEQFGSVETSKSTFTIHFEKVADITSELKEAVVKKIGGFVEPTQGVATVYVCPKSFVFDGKTYAESLCFTYEVAGSGVPTGIESINAENSNVEIYDLQGRRVMAPVKGNLYIQNGKKVMK
ncbi:MAG: discoidin domain-containing protein [Alloprevotella sp.]